MKRSFTLVLSLIFFSFSGFLQAQSSGVIINEVYGGGGNAGAAIKNDFIELYNKSATPVDVSGWSVQYASSTGTTWARTILSGTIPANGYYLIQQSAGTGGTVDLPAPNTTGTIAMSGTAGKVVLVNNSTLITAGTSCPSGAMVIDLVGYGAANCFEGAPPEGGPTVAPSNTASVSRSETHIDTDNNRADFVLGLPSPVSATLAKTIGVTAGTNASEPSTAGSFLIAFSETTTAQTTLSYSLTTGAGQASFNTDYTINLNAGSSFSPPNSPTGVISIPAGVSSLTFSINPVDDNINEGAEAISITLSNPGGGYIMGQSVAAITLNDNDLDVTKISAIQGAGSAASPGNYAVEGIVTAVYPSWSPSGYFVQEEDSDADGNLNTSEGIFVIQNNPSVTVGDKVRLIGLVQENNLTPSFNQAVLIASSSSIISSGNTLPLATLFSLPVAGQSELERFEGMLVQYNGTLTVTDNSELGNRGSLALAAGGLLYQPTQVIDPNDADPAGVTTSGTSNVAAISAYSTSNVARSILLDDGSNNVPTSLPYVNNEGTNRVGSTINNLTGILGFGFSAYRLQPVSYALPVFNFAARPALPSLTGNLKIASFNVLNYFNGNGTGGGFPTSRGANSVVEFNRQRDKIISALSQINADVVGLIEIENDGTGPASAIQDIVNGLNEVSGAGTYAFINDGATSQTFNTDEIRSGIIYKPGAVTPVGSPITTDNTVFERPPLAQTFKLKGVTKEFTYIINHFKSKGGCPAPATAPNANLDNGDGQSCWNERRKQQAEALANFINKVVIPSSGNDRVLSMGDYNAYYEEDPMDVLRANKLVVLGSAASYSYLFDGQLGSLDHAVATASMNNLLAGFAKWNLNSAEPTYLDYNDALRDPGEGTIDVNPWSALYSTTPFRSSDHDAVIASFTIPTSSDLKVLKTATDVVSSGGIIEYRITVANDGPDEAGGVILKDMVPAGTGFVSLVAPGGWIISTPQVGASGSIEASIPILNKTMGEQIFTLKVKANCELPNATIISNSASITGQTGDLNSSNNTATANSTINASQPSVVIPDANALNIGVLPNTVYLGYGPASSLSLSTQVSGGTGDLLYTWSNGGSSPALAVSPRASTTYTVNVTDQNGCTGSASRLVHVIDVRAGRKGDKVLVCHKPAKHMATLEVASSAVMDHLLHGDMLGSCWTQDDVLKILAKISIVAYPNPSNNYFIINLWLKGEGNFTVIVRDIFGKTVEVKKELQPGQALKLGAEYKAGLYFVELIQGNERHVLKLFKL